MDMIRSKNEKEEIQDPRSSVRVTFCVHNWLKYPFLLGSLKSFDDHELFHIQHDSWTAGSSTPLVFPKSTIHGRQT